MFVNRGIYHNGLDRGLLPQPPLGRAECRPTTTTSGSSTAPTTGPSRTTSPPSSPRRLVELQRLFLIEAARYNVLPLDDRRYRALQRRPAGRPHAGPRQVPDCSSVRMGQALRDRSVLVTKNKPTPMTAQIDVPGRRRRTACSSPRAAPSAAAASTCSDGRPPIGADTNQQVCWLSTGWLPYRCASEHQDSAGAAPDVGRRSPRADPRLRHSTRSATAATEQPRWATWPAERGVTRAVLYDHFASKIPVPRGGRGTERALSRARRRIDLWLRHAARPDARDDERGLRLRPGAPADLEPSVRKRVERRWRGRRRRGRAAPAPRGGRRPAALLRFRGCRHRPRWPPCGDHRRDAHLRPARRGSNGSGSTKRPQTTT